MERFQPNTRFYKENFNSFTSRDEFDAKKRVQITNEMPPMDMYDFAHSMIKNDLWKWFFGYSIVMNDMTYNEDTDGVETIDNEGNISNLTIAKYVNGVRAKDYGPVPEKKWNPNYKKDYKEYLDYIKDDPTYEDTLTEDDFKYKIDYSKKGRRIEIDGALLPEVDLMLHEAYRYLSVLYPDHPDFMELLTTNEFEDDIAQAASIIDYVPDQVFFNWLSTKLDYSSVTEDHIEDAKIEEAAKLKVRNLLNHSMRRKFYGSKTGYEMFGSDIFQHVTVFPAAQVIPYKCFDDNRTDEEVSNPYSVDFKWLRAFEDMPDNFKTAEREINKSHVLYKKRVRLLDWTNESYKFPERWVEPAKFYGTAWPTPYSQFVLYEYPLQKVIDEKDYDELKDGLSTTRTIKNDFKVGQKIKIGGQNSNWRDYQEGHISSITEEATYAVEVNADNNKITVHENPNTLTVVNVDVPVNPFYTQFEIWPSNEKIINTFAEYERWAYFCKDGLINHYPERLEKSIVYGKKYSSKFEKYAQMTNFYEATEQLHTIYCNENKDIFDKLDSAKIAYRLMNIGKFTPDPHQDGCMYMSPEQFMTTFEDELNIKLNTSSWNDYTEETFYDENGNANDWPVSEIEYGITNMASDGYVQKGDILKFDNGIKTFESQVLGISNAFVQFDISKGQASLDEVKLKVKEAQDAETSRYGLVLKLSENNEDSAGKKVVFYGNMTCGEPIEVDAKRHFTPDSIYFNIKAIPRVKSHMAMRAIYKSDNAKEDFSSICSKKFACLFMLIGEGDGKSKYSIIAKDIVKFSETYDKLRVAFDELIKAAEEDKLLYNDKHWKNLDEKAKEYISLFEENRPILYKKLSFIYVDWLKNNNKILSSRPPLDEIKRTINGLYSVFEEYYKEYYSWQVEEAAIDISRDYYIEELAKDYGAMSDKKLAVAGIIECDKKLFEEMLPNRALLLSPLPEDIFMNELPTKDSSYTLLTGQDEFVSIIEFEKNKYDDMIDQKLQPLYGTFGLLQNCMNYSCDAWNFGSINTATVVETHYNSETKNYETCDVKDEKNKIDFIDDYYHSAKDWIQKYNVSLPKSDDFVLSETNKSYTQEEYDSLDDTHLKENHLYNDNDIYKSEDAKMTFMSYFKINEDVQTLFDNDDNSHKFAYGDPNMMEMFLEDD